MAESQSAHSDWRRQSWEDYEFRDGKAWTRAAFNRLVSKGINPLTINRIFPILNLIHGNFIKNQQDIIAKGRTKSDSELGQVMSEAFAFVKDKTVEQKRLQPLLMMKLQLVMDVLRYSKTRIRETK